MIMLNIKQEILYQEKENLENNLKKMKKKQKIKKGVVNTYGVNKSKKLFYILIYDKTIFF